MKRGNIRTTKVYRDENGKRVIKYRVEGRRNGLWIPVVEQDKNKVKREMIYDTMQEANDKLKEIIGQIKKPKVRG